MEKHGIGKWFTKTSGMVVLTFGIYSVLNIHGEVLESLAPADTTLEEAFLPTLKQLHDRFPQLRIVVCMPLI